ncbi:hypothetical protein [Luteimonas aquatica]|uniref:hypothetical protein n=1 Tax=Luteimonas aquatica TaxID=450364 RepID=UPI001F5AB9A1|nr:hypothetical protein [Luteimonas aquatica]
MAIDATRATQVVHNNFVDFDTARQNDQNKADGKISEDDLRTVADNADGRFSSEEVEAARFLLDSRAARSALDVGAGHGSVDGTIGREDIDAAMDAISGGTFERQLLDTASGRGGRDGFASVEDIDAALRDPGVPQTVKDALMLMRQGFTGDASAFNALVQGMSAEDFANAAQIYNSDEFGLLPCVPDQALIAEIVRNANGDSAVSADLLQLLRDPAFQNMDAAGKNAKLEEFALLNSPQFDALPLSDQRLITEALANREPGDTDLPGSIRSLIASDGFQKLSPDAQTATLSQVRNYPDSRAISNLERLAALDWFQNMSLGDMQRSLKTIAHMSVYDNGGDRTTLDNTLEKLLDPNQGYSMEWTAQAPGVGAHSNPGTKLVSMNSADVLANNDPITAGTSAEWQAVNALSHEINHAIDDVHVATTYEYLDKEYQAYVTGNEAESGQPMTRQEAAATWRGLLDPNGIYAYASWGISRDNAGNVTGDVTGAMEDPTQAALICAELSRLTGVNVTVANYQQVLSDPGSWNPPEQPGQPSGPIPPDARPQGNTDNS